MRRAIFIILMNKHEESGVQERRCLSILKTLSLGVIGRVGGVPVVGRGGGGGLSPVGRKVAV